MMAMSMATTTMVVKSMAPATRPACGQRFRHFLSTGASIFACLLFAMPVPLWAACTSGNILRDGGFEAGFVTTYWNTQTSTNFGTPLCDASCGGVGPRTGAYWAWFGGIPAAEIATAGQTVRFPTAGPASITLNFYMWISTVNAPFTDTLVVKVDGVTKMTFPEPQVAESGYTLRSIDLTSLADGAVHAILFENDHAASAGPTNFNVDDVSLDVVCTTPPVFQHGASRRVHGAATFDLPL